MTDLWRKDDDANRVYFDDRVRSYDLDAKSADWGSRESQYLRFSVLAAVDRLDGRRILDVGCGTGEFFAFLSDRRVEVDYTGIDISPAMIVRALQRFPEATFVEGSVLDLGTLFAAPFDNVFSSGIFTRRHHNGRAFVSAAVAAMFGLCSRSLSFNCLSAWAEHRQPDEFHIDPVDAIAIGRQHTARLILRHDYHPADLTLHLYRQGGGS